MSTVPLPLHSLILTALLAFLICSSVRAQGPAPAPESGADMPWDVAPAPLTNGADCTSQLANVSSCLSYVERGSNLTVPDKGCCPSFASLVNDQPLCLCQLLASSSAFGIAIDDAKALMLPSSCRIDAPSVSLCAVLGIPVPSPVELAPSPATGFQPGGPLIPAGIAPGSSANAPSTTSTSTNTKSTISMAILAGCLLIAVMLRAA